MSKDRQTVEKDAAPEAAHASESRARTSARTRDAGPQPEPLRFFGTTWVLHDGGYRWRRAGVGVGALLAAVLGAVVLRVGFAGLSDARIGTFVTVVAIVGFAVCSVLAFQRTWRGFSARRAPGEPAEQGLYAVGFIGTLLAHAARCVVEAPGEGLRRTEYEEARARHAVRKGRPKAKPQGRRRR